MAAPRPQYPKFRLRFATIAAFVENGKLNTIHLQPDMIITVLDGLYESTEPNRQVSVHAERRNFKMFAIDILERGSRV
jgi:hypothetical protein